MFNLNSNIEIAAFKRVKPIEVKVEKSMFSYVDKALIKLPITARIKRAGEVITEAVETAKQFGEGDKVLIQLGYNGKLRTEFEGFISRVNFTAPVEIECEGFIYQLRQKTYAKTWKNTELKEILQYLVAGSDIKLDAGIPSFKLEKFALAQHNGAEALEMIKKASDNTVRIFFTGNVLYAGLQYLKPKFDVKYRLGWNVIKDGNLKLRQAKNQDVTVHYIGEKKDGTKLKVQVGGKTVTKANVIKSNAYSGTTGETKIIKSHAITDESSLKAMANAKLKQLSYDGYEGKITAFGVPYCEPGCRAVLEDFKYPDRSGNYIIETLEVTYGNNGYRRIVGIGAKL